MLKSVFHFPAAAQFVFLAVMATCILPNTLADDHFAARNRGTNQNWMTNAVDLDGNTRIRYGTVDMGSCELIFSGSIYKFR